MYEEIKYINWIKYSIKINWKTQQQKFRFFHSFFFQVENEYIHRTLNKIRLSIPVSMTKAMWTICQLLIQSYKQRKFRCFFEWYACLLCVWFIWTLSWYSSLFCRICFTMMHILENNIISCDQTYSWNCFREIIRMIFLAFLQNTLIFHVEI